MIHAKDLMIGDYIRTKNGNIAIVATIWKDAIFTEDGEFEGEQLNDGEFDPIPLTPEILEKSGFVARYAYGQKKWHIDIYNDFHRKVDDNGDITLNVYSERKMEWRLSIDTDRNERTVVYIRFVHELQHALRLCGIEKEIVL